MRSVVKGLVCRFPQPSAPYWNVGIGERWLLLGEGLGTTAARMLSIPDVELVVVSPRILDFEPLREFKLIRERDRLQFFCSARFDPDLLESHSFDGLATAYSIPDHQKYLRPGGRFIVLAS